eukprot:s16_g29.t1
MEGSGESMEETQPGEHDGGMSQQPKFGQEAGHELGDSVDAHMAGVMPPHQTQPEVPFETQPEVTLETRPGVPLETQPGVLLETHSLETLPGVPHEIQPEVPLGDTQPEVSLETQPGVPHEIQPEVPLGDTQPEVSLGHTQPGVPFEAKPKEDPPIVPAETSRTKVEPVPEPRNSDRQGTKRQRATEDDSGDLEYFSSSSVPPPELSDKAIYCRMNRIFKPGADGSYILDERWNKPWNDVIGGGRDEIKSMFEKVGYERDWLYDRFIKRCKAISERINEEVTEIEGEWLTVADMQRLQFTERTKRHITREVKEWEEDMEDGFDDKAAPELDWGFMDGPENQDNKPVPGH